MNNFLNLSWIVVIIGAIVAAASGFVEISLEQLKSGDILTLLLTAIFVALVIERAVEVYANNRFDPEQAQIQGRVTVIESVRSFKQKELKAEQASPQPDPAIVTALRNDIDNAGNDLLAEREKIEPRLADLRRRKAAFAGALATILALAASVVGVRVLGQFLPTDDSVISGELGRMLAASDEATKQAAELQLGALRFVDVVLTTALLAGGADGIHQIIKRFTDIRSGS